MEYTKLPKVKIDKQLKLPHFPDMFHAAVFRLWETVSKERIAAALGTSCEIVQKAADDMGLPKQCVNPNWKNRGYITTIRNAWQILPYDQLLKLLDWSEEKLASVLKDDDFLEIKLGNFKPYCEKVEPKALSSEQRQQLNKIKNTVKAHFANMFQGDEAFDFFSDSHSESFEESTEGIRMIYSYCGLYAGVLDNDISLSYPEALLKKYKKTGINAVWLPVLLYQLVPFPFDNSYSAGWQMRQKRLNELIEIADKYNIKVYLYLNEPRCMPLEFFDSHPELMGSKMGAYASLCTSNSQVLKYLYNAVNTICKAAPKLGGFFAITCSEYLTHCKSRHEGSECPNCNDVPIWRLVSDILSVISNAATSVNPDIRTIAWTWAWDDYMTKEEIEKCIDMLPREIIIQCNSEAQKEFIIGGVKGNIMDYSMSIPGPAPLSEHIWNYAKAKGHEVSAKVQVNTTWECSTLPFIPVFDLVKEHMQNLKKCGVEHVMFSWTLGGYPSFNLKLASAFISNSAYSDYDELLKNEFGEYASRVKKAAKIFSDAFRHFPFHIDSLYFGPQNAGPSNLLYYKPSGFNATMTGYAYDDLETWRAIYPTNTYINQLKKLSEGWKDGLNIISAMPDCIFKYCAYGAYAIFRSSYIQAEFIKCRESGGKAYLSSLVEEEIQNTLLMYDIMSKCSSIGYEAANHYYFNKGMLAEKLVNCEYIKEKIKTDKNN